MADILSPELPAAADHPLRDRITDAWSMDETQAVEALLAQAELPAAQRELVLAQA
jgi:RHH-type proline utilization regulon transcriptional repressor/proline dehydrogenase/delta 1-pyrroline-5-carboxylate dehydrogenase